MCVRVTPEETGGHRIALAKGTTPTGGSKHQICHKLNLNLVYYLYCTSTYLVESSEGVHNNKSLATYT